MATALTYGRLWYNPINNWRIWCTFWMSCLAVVMGFEALKLWSWTIHWAVAPQAVMLWLESKFATMIEWLALFKLNVACVWAGRNVGLSLLHLRCGIGQLCENGGTSHDWECVATRHESQGRKMEKLGTNIFHLELRIMMTLDSQRLFLIEDETDRKRIETHGEMMLISHRHGNLHTRLIPFQTHTHTHTHVY